MSFLVNLTLFGWVPLMLFLYRRMPAQRAVVLGFIAAWLFLPIASFAFVGIPDLSKTTATIYGVVLAVVLFDVGRLSGLRFSLLDLPVFAWCLSPFLSSVTNGLGLYDGATGIFRTAVFWALPYFIGKLFLGNLRGLYCLACGIAVGGLIYAPLCLLEVRISPQLHNMVYGYHQHSFAQTFRYGGWRPVVFMQHGLEVGIWMMAATLVAVWLWRVRALTILLDLPLLETFELPMLWVCALLLLTFVLLKSTGAYGLFLLGGLALAIARKWRTSLPILAIGFLVCGYLSVATLSSNVEYQDRIITSLERIGLPQDRLASLRFRFINEEMLADKARQRLLFGWGGWGRSRIRDENGKDITVTDSLWIIYFGQNGLYGLGNLYAMMMLPPMLYLWNFRKQAWRHPHLAAPSVLATVVILYMLDCLVNAMLNPIFILSAGAIAGLVQRGPQVLRPSRRQPPRQRLVRQLPRRQLAGNLARR